MTPTRQQTKKRSEKEREAVMMGKKKEKEEEVEREGVRRMGGEEREGQFDSLESRGLKVVES